MSVATTDIKIVPILLYHSVSDTPTGGFGPFTVSRGQFADHLDVLLDRGFTVLTVGEFMTSTIAGAVLPERTVVLSVDDGFEDFITQAWPELHRRGLNATLYVTTGMLGRTSRWLAPLRAGGIPMLTHAQLRDLAAAGCEIGAHSVSHPQLDTLSLSAAAREIAESKDVLEQLLDRRVDHFAYPHGYHSLRIKKLVAALGFTSAAAVRNALSFPGDDPLALARVTIGPEHDAASIGRLLDGAGAPVAHNGETIKTKIWRQYRRGLRLTGTSGVTP